ncbi:lipoate--protein ligase family protein [Natranaerofaba carboxydovora]|uniref:lipoate--protein ligase family protein n=1 Tax=Natranaerofaba carboxydovora TaxID=2742683 RepID=UPI001F13CE4B|nr:biotin/lipoate A/B protein ligase family protein [Natranaerofaba carboxydovora]UMZ74298.1 Octanoyltransferase LipM [Natranaerofaba carboxydovora]
MGKEKWRLLLDGPLRGSENMARDEALLKSYYFGKKQPVFRIYDWKPDCISLGYFQKATSEINLDGANKLNVDIVRRPTGGRGVLHANEITYCLVMEEKFFGISKSVIESYKFLIQGIKKGLEALGLNPEIKTISKKEEKKQGKLNFSSACFDSSSWYELLLDNRKVVGSAQTRRKGVILQHGSIKLHYKPELDVEVFNFKPSLSKTKIINTLNKRAIGIMDINPSLNKSECKKAIIKGFEEAFNIEFIEDEYTELEKEWSMRLQQSKYCSKEWNLNKRKGDVNIEKI